VKVFVDVSVCQGYGNCVTAAPDFFDLDESAQAMVLKATVDTPDEERDVRGAMRLCPVSAIRIEE
jgi:ferredoxin